MESCKNKIDRNRVPQHIAIIMDGNGRWARKHGISRIFGHENGVKSVRSTVEGAGEVGVKYLTLYAFSTENWERPRYEVDALMGLLVQTIEAETDELMKNNVKLGVIGDIAKMPESVRNNLQKCMDALKNNTGLHLILALSYSSQWEITEAVRKIAMEVQSGKLLPDEINPGMFSDYLSTSGIPDPEMLIRTSGEYRISNFLLWQIVYAELYFTDILWPDFRKEDLFEAICKFQKRERRFGKTSEQLNS